MTLNVLFWVLYIVALLFGLWSSRAATNEKGNGGRAGFNDLVLWILIGFLGWSEFGAIHR